MKLSQALTENGNTCEIKKIFAIVIEYSRIPPKFFLNEKQAYVYHHYSGHFNSRQHAGWLYAVKVGIYYFHSLDKDPDSIKTEELIPIEEMERMETEIKRHGPRVLMPKDLEIYGN